MLQQIDGLLPDARGISAFSRPGTVTILSADGEVLQKLGPASRENWRWPNARAGEGGLHRRGRSPLYQHNGVDVVGINRAVVTNLQSGSVKQGASTITQQLARVVFLNQDQTLIRKVKEAASP